MKKYILSQQKWKKIYSFLKTVSAIHTSNERSVRNFIQDVLTVIKEGCRWRILGKRYRKIHKRYKEWAHKKVFESLMMHCSDPDREYTMLDATIIRAHMSAAGYYKSYAKAEKLGRSKGGLTTKIHAKVDALGYPLNFILSPGQSHESLYGIELLRSDEKYDYVIADKGYDSKNIVRYIEHRGGISIIPSKRNAKKPRKYDKHIYKERNIIERFFAQLKQWRGIATRYAKSATVFLENLHLVGALIWLK